MSEVAIRELVLDGGAEEGQPRHSATRRSVPTFEVVVNSGADFAVRRRCGRSSRLWVMLVSQAQYYIKDERTGEVRRLDDKALASFLAGCGTLHVGCQWLDHIENEKECRGLLLSTLLRQGFRKAASSGVWRIEDQEPVLMAHSRGGQDGLALAAAYLPLAKSAGAKVAQVRGTRESAIRASFPALTEVQEAYGLDCARRLLEAYCESRAKSALPHEEMRALLSIRRDDDGWNAGVRRAQYVPLGDRPRNRDECVRFDFSRFSRYLLEQSAREGMACELTEWVAFWRDSLRLQLAVYGKVVDKYPDSLLTTHQRLIFASRDVRARLDIEAQEEAVRAMSALDRRVEGEPYLVTHPTCVQDMKDEAAMQRNCLVGYIGSVMRGDDIVMFCRRADAPDRSHVTLEVAPATMRLVQAKARSNREPDDETMRFLSKWCAEAGVHPGRYAERMRGLGR